MAFLLSYIRAISFKRLTFSQLRNPDKRFIVRQGRDPALYHLSRTHTKPEVVWTKRSSGSDLGSTQRTLVPSTRERMIHSKDIPKESISRVLNSLCLSQSLSISRPNDSSRLYFFFVFLFCLSKEPVSIQKRFPMHNV